MNKETQQQAEEAVRLQHQQWLEMPATRTVLSALTKHKDEFIDLLIAHATNQSVTDQQLRLHAVSLKTIDATIQLLTNTELLITKLNK